MAWFVGGTAMMRSSSDSSLPEDSSGFVPPYLYPRARRTSWSESGDVYGGGDDYDDDDDDEDVPPLYPYAEHYATPYHLAEPPRGSPSRRHMPSFYILKEGVDYHYPSHLGRHLASSSHPGSVSDGYSDNPTPPGGSLVVLEQTSNGLSIASDADRGSLLLDDEDEDTLSDGEAADRVEAHLLHRSRRRRDTRIGRILQSLICPKSPGAEFAIDDDALQGIFAAANELFFHGSLKGRVTWDWSGGATSQYQHKVIGTTALRRAAGGMGGYETLIVLSRPILRNARYNRRLLISTFLHELIHSYMFISCGFSAREHGGHTAGFRRVAALIDAWIGPDILFLCNMEANLDDFVDRRQAATQPATTSLPLPLPLGPSPCCNVLNSCHMHWPTTNTTATTHTEMNMMGAETNMNINMNMNMGMGMNTGKDMNMGRPALVHHQSYPLSWPVRTR